MKTFISHYTAANHWKIPCIHEALGCGTDGTGPTHITVTDRRDRYPLLNHKIHLCELDLPEDALVCRNDTVVASPELVFLQLASELSIHRLILLGLQLCSHPPGNPSMAITTKQKITTLLAKISGHRGHRKSLRAIKYVVNGSASIMESMVYMILTLPNCLGGFGLAGAVFNHEIELGEKGVDRLGQKRCYADLFYKSDDLAVEYDSFSFHSSPMEQGRDMIRSVILEGQGIDVMHLSTIQLYDRDACVDFALKLANHLGRRMRIRTNKFGRMHRNLRALLPSGKFVEKFNGR